MAMEHEYTIEHYVAKKKAIPDPTALILTAFSALPCSEAFVYCQFHMEKLLSDSLPPRHQSPCV